MHIVWLDLSKYDECCCLLLAAMWSGVAEEGFEFLFYFLMFYSDVSSFLWFIILLGKKKKSARESGKMTKYSVIPSQNIKKVRLKKSLYIKVEASNFRGKSKT